MEKPGKSAAYNSELESKSAKENVTSDAAAGRKLHPLAGVRYLNLTAQPLQNPPTFPFATHLLHQ